MIKRKSSVCKIKNKSFYSEKLIKFQGDAKKTVHYERTNW